MVEGKARGKGAGEGAGGGGGRTKHRHAGRGLERRKQKNEANRWIRRRSLTKGVVGLETKKKTGGEVERQKLRGAGLFSVSPE